MYKVFFDTALHSTAFPLNTFSQGFLIALIGSS